MIKKISITGSLVLCTTLSFGFDLGNITKGVMENMKSSNITSSSKRELSSQSNITNGLKEALRVGVNYAVRKLGSNNGYLNNSLVKIPLPENLQKVEGIIRKAGGDKMANDLINSMNNAATQAASKTTEIFIDAIDKLWG